jgi:hypothetical protein
MDETKTRDALLAMDAGRELDAEIARLAGKIPAGMKLDRLLTCPTQAAIWQATNEGGIVTTLRVRYYSDDADAALSLPIDDDRHWYLKPTPKGWEAEVAYYEAVGPMRGKTVAYAAVRAWIDWRLPGYSYHTG